MEEVKLRVLNLCLRAGSMGSKFIFIVFIAKYLTLYETGLYGLFASTVAFSMLLLGGEFYTYSQREILGAEKKKWGQLIKNQVSANGLLYLIILPLQLIVFALGFLPYELLLLYFLLLVGEHIAQEINRLLITFQRQLAASFVLFFRLGAWCWVSIGLFLYSEEYQSISTVLWCWLFGTMTAILIGFYYVRQEVPSGLRGPIKIEWIKKGYKVALKFLLATLGYKAIMTFDRYAIEVIGGEELLAVYVVYISLAMAINSVLVPTVFSFVYPKLVAAFKKNQLAEYRKYVRELLVSVLTIGGGVALLIGLSAPFTFELIDKEVYKEHIFYLWLLLLMSFLYSLSMVPHYVLYAKGRDSKVLFSHLAGLIVFLAGGGVSYMTKNVDYIFYTLILSMASLGLCKLYFGLQPIKELKN